MNSPITLDALLVLETIERKQSFAAAADALFRVPSAISYTVNKLEEDLGVALFDRSKRKAELTIVGKKVVEQGRLLLKASEELTHMAQQAANGWESELRICVDSVVNFDALYQLINAFHKIAPWINIQISEEVLAGTWDSLISNNCDLVIGATGEPHNSDFTVQPLGSVAFVFAVAKNHPLTQESLPISNSTIKNFTSVVVADSSKNQPPRSIGLLDGQSRITVHSVDKKIEAQLYGLGVGFLPEHRIKSHLASGALVALPLAEHDNRHNELSVAWRKKNQGKALQWFVEQITTNAHQFLSANISN